MQCGSPALWRRPELLQQELFLPLNIYQYCLLPALAAVQQYAVSNRAHSRSPRVIFTIHSDNFPEQQQYVVTTKEKTCAYCEMQPV